MLIFLQLELCWQPLKQHVRNIQDPGSLRFLHALKYLLEEEFLKGSPIEHMSFTDIPLMEKTQL